MSTAPATRREKRPERDEVDEADSSGIQDTIFLNPLVIAVVPAVGSILTGSDLFKDVIHLVFLLYYVNALIKVPWEMYTRARARRPAVNGVDGTAFTSRRQRVGGGHAEDSEEEPEGARTPTGKHSSNILEEDQIIALARTELRLAELIYLAFTIVAPFLGALLLKSVSKLLSIDSISTFSISLFILATGIRPWRHMVDLLRNRTEALHDVVHSLPEQSLTARVQELEQIIEKLLVEQNAANRSLVKLESTVDRNIKEIGKNLKNSDTRFKSTASSLDKCFGELEERVSLVEKKVNPGGISGGPVDADGRTPRRSYFSSWREWSGLSGTSDSFDDEVPEK